MGKYTIYHIPNGLSKNVQCLGSLVQRCSSIEESIEALFQDDEAQVKDGKDVVSRAEWIFQTPVDRLKHAG
jgi:hypothetical protein